MLLDGKRAFITGASRGIGAELAKGLADHGADIVITDLAQEMGKLTAVAAEIHAKGRKCETFALDVTDSSMITEVLERAGPIDVLVNNAGILVISALEKLSENLWDAHFDVNAKGVFLMTNAVLPQMRERKAGRIINIASLAARQGLPGQGHYAATKAVDVTLTRVYAQEAGMDGITINAICPGIILTEMGKSNLGDQAAIDHWTNAAALKRLGDPKDIVGPTVFFASDLAGFVTGQALNVCGGLYFH